MPLVAPSLSCYSCIVVLLSPDSVRRLLLDYPHTFHCGNNFVLGEIRNCLGVSSDAMFPWISSNSCLLNLLLVRSLQAETNIIKRLIQGSSDVTRVQVEPRSCDHGRCENDVFMLSVTQSTTVTIC